MDESTILLGPQPSKNEKKSSIGAHLLSESFKMEQSYGRPSKNAHFEIKNENQAKFTKFITLI
jgi:hypothetical protein